jgi:hypothetical protein
LLILTALFLTALTGLILTCLLLPRLALSWLTVGGGVLTLLSALFAAALLIRTILSGLIGSLVAALA